MDGFATAPLHTRGAFKRGKPRERLLVFSNLLLRTDPTRRGMQLPSVELDLSIQFESLGLKLREILVPECSVELVNEANLIAHVIGENLR